MNAEQSPLNAFIVQIAGEAARIACAQLIDQLPAILREILAEYPQIPAPVEADRLLSLEEVAARLGCGKQLVIQRMARGEIIWTQEAGTGDRKVKASRLEEYIKSLPEYRGRKCDALPVAV
ncbi:hypothetical protein [Selenomonas artemidis]|uniref:hypothetical protein n=1 Tax=Selenomonas artemidis TaxID=671224 RepID=UPI0028890EAB|nr:hypothetical protein [Selenomonas artemidis]